MMENTCQNKNFEYEDIITMSHHESSKHPRLSKEQRAAQFAPFAALTGFEDAIAETARMTNRKIELDEEEKIRLDQELKNIQNDIEKKPLVKFIYFVKDDKKQGGAYKEITDNVLKIDEVNKIIKLKTMNLKIDDIYLIESVKE